MLGKVLREKPGKLHMKIILNHVSGKTFGFIVFFFFREGILKNEKSGTVLRESEWCSFQPKSFYSDNSLLVFNLKLNKKTK